MQFYDEDGNLKQPTAPIAPPAIPMPNGGMTGQTLQDYISANPGPQATTGFNPGNPGDGSPSIFDLINKPAEAEDDEDESPIAGSGRSPSSKGAPAAQAVAQALSASGPAASAGPSPAASPYGADADDAALKAAMASRDHDIQAAQYGKAGNLIGAAIASRSGGGVKTYNDVWDDIEKNSGNKIQDVATIRKGVTDKEAVLSTMLKNANEKEKQDPNSGVSKLTTSSLKEMLAKSGLTGINVPDSMSAESAEKVFPILERYLQHVETNNARKDAAKDKLDAKTQDKVDKMSKEMGQDLDPNKARTGAMGDNQKRFNTGERIETLYNAVGGDPTNVNMRELATTVASMLSSGGTTAVHQINELVPPNLKGNITKIQDWLTSEPHGAGQQKFAQMYLHIAQREKELADQQIKQAQFKKAYSTHHRLLETSPEDFYTNLSRQTGLEPAEIKAMEAEQGFNGQYKKSAQTSGKAAAGDVVTIKGKGKFKVGADGDSLTPVTE